MPLWWLSFADADRPEGEQFLGGCAIEAPTALIAIGESWRRGLNPGGEVAFSDISMTAFPRALENRLLSRADLEREGL